MRAVPRIQRHTLTLSLVLAAGCSVQTGGLGGADAGADMDVVVPPFDSGGDSTVPDGFVPTDGAADGVVPLEDAGTDGGFNGGMDAGMDAGPVDAGCTSALDACSGSTESVCDPSTETLETRSCPAGCHATAPRCARVAPSNVPTSAIDEAAADVTIGSNTTWNASTCSRTGMTPVMQTGGSMVCVMRTGNFDVDATLTVEGDRPLVVLAEGAVTIVGTIDVSAYGTTPGPGGSRGGDRGHRDGYGPRFGGGGTHASSYEDGGGGGGGACGAGGAGGIGEDAPGGGGGAATSAAWVLSPLLGGSGGGLGQGAYSSGSYDNNGYGGAGGGALQITSQVSIEVRGRILPGGGGGDGGGRTSSGSSINFGAGGGGGSGGSVLLEAPAIAFPGSSAIIATGGGGAGSASDGGDGEPGQDGAETAARAAGGARGGSDFGANGGQSGGGSTLGGENGDDNRNNSGNGGGGGGGAGCVLLRTAGGVAPAGTSGFSPDVPIGLRTLAVALY